MKVKFELSSQLFQGYKFEIEKDKIESLDQVAQSLKHNLMEDLKMMNLVYLYDSLLHKTFHHHNYNIMDVFHSEDPHKVWYICESCVIP